MPLRTKLIVLVLSLLTVAIGLIGVASTMAMRRYLTEHIDDQLKEDANIRAENRVIQTPGLASGGSGPGYFVAFGPAGDGTVPWPDDIDPSKRHIYPDFPDDLASLADRAGDPFTVSSGDGGAHWRVKVTKLSGGRLIVIAMSTKEMDKSLQQLMWINVYGGISVLLFAATIGTELIRRSFRPLSAMERTAGKIAEGDLTQRVPDPEEGAPYPRTEVGSLARSLNSMLSQIEVAFTAQAASEADARKSEDRMRRFVADASHELRTPLTTIRGFAELYRQGAVTTPEKVAQLVKRIEDEAARMGLLVEDLLLLARLDRERPLRHQPVELRVLAVEAVQAARVIAADRQIDLVTAPDAGQLVVNGDDARLRQIIGNLMSNAMAHTPAGTPIKLTLRAEPGQPGETGWAVIEVTDHGPGLDPEQRERVFERFYRADTARTRKADGSMSTGLGLAIVAALVAAHEGAVEVDSRPGEGATFRVRLPLGDEVDP